MLAREWCSPQDGIESRTRFGIVRVEWKAVAGKRCWFSSGTGDAKREVVTAIERIEHMCQTMH